MASPIFHIYVKNITAVVNYTGLTYAKLMTTIIMYWVFTEHCTDEVQSNIKRKLYS